MSGGVKTALCGDVKYISPVPTSRKFTIYLYHVTRGAGGDASCVLSFPLVCGGTAVITVGA